MQMPWGKYASIEIADIDSNYLHWCLGNAATLSKQPWLKLAIQRELFKRGELPSFVDPEEEHPLVVAWKSRWKDICWHGHPDRGGNEELFKILTAYNDFVNGKK